MSAQATTKQRPAIDFQEAGCKVAVWKFPNDSGGFRYNLRATFSYREDSGAWKDTEYFSPTQAAVLAQLLSEAHAWVQSDRRENS